ncbi:twin-arginine translocation signal domain-containing protein [Nocardioides sp. AX2bis]|uniref:twin-arginine translocation signal domain-containing protein n=1 Tax=Nocardioides sp. AX2bis TaxID=2653157 RepID=UPI0012EF1ECC|nr:twin-arginine translocation signal domain-containing protein [Nocardioides sp. AX2bis]VXB31420.1 Flagellar hook-associated protein flgK [Nocardioides sp. AX2bis]
MSDTSRRKFLAATGVTAAVGGAALVGTASAASAKPSARAARERVLVLVDDPKSDVVTLLVGEDEVVVRDRDLVTRILNAAGGTR